MGQWPEIRMGHMYGCPCLACRAVMTWRFAANSGNSASMGSYLYVSVLDGKCVIMSFLL